VTRGKLSYSVRATYAAPVAILIVWAIFVAWRPVILGFYHDDWSLLTVASPYGAPLLSGGGQTRPLYVGLGYLAVTLFGTNTYLWHTYGALLVLVVAMILYLCGYEVAKALNPDNGSARFAAMVGAASWMLFPWGLGYAAWPVMFPGLWQVGLVGLSAWLVLLDSRKPANLVVAALALVASTLIYEAFWLSFLPIALLALAVDQKKSVWNAIRVALALGLPQSLVICWSLYVGSIGGGGGKRVNTRLLDLLGQLPTRLAQWSGLDVAIVYGLLCIALLGLALIIWLYIRNRAISLILVATTSGILISAIIFSAAGYALTPSGVFSRTFIAINLWLAVLIAALFAVAAGTQMLGKAYRAVGVAALVVLGVFSVSETLRWAESWEFQKAFLAGVPEAATTLGAQSDILVLEMPDRVGRIESIGAFWDATAAVYMMAPKLREAIEGDRLWVTVSRAAEWRTHWDGEELTQYWCREPETPLWKRSAAVAYSLAPGTSRLEVIEADTSLGC